MKRVEKMELSELIEQFTQAAQGYEGGIEHGTVKQANRNTAIGDRVVKELKRRGEEHELLVLLDHPTPIVRGRAAAYALRFASDAALPVMEELANNVYGAAGADAVTNLMMWQEEKSRT